jgi:hypothetical protein
MRLPFLHVLALAIGLASTSGVATAQDLTRERVQAELDRTDQRIEQAEIVVSSSNNEIAESALNDALRIQAQAKSAFAGGQLRLALDLTYRARTLALRAIALVRGLPDPDRVLAQLERTREMLERARDRIEECNEDRARSMLRAAFEMQARAEGAARAEHFLAAFQLTVSARERALRALRLCNVEENLRESADRALHRSDEVIVQAKDRVSGNPSESARQALSRAIELQDRAYGEFRMDHPKASLRLTQSARAFAFRAIRLSHGSS